jgi:hypothetical protein
MTKIYYGTKKVEAWPEGKLERPIIPASDPPDNEILGTIYKDGYAVKYEDGYTSWSPKDVFEKSYMPTDAMDLGRASQAMKDGYSVCREHWRGVRRPRLSILDGRIICTDDGKITVDPWVPEDSEDLLATDWMIVP